MRAVETLRGPDQRQIGSIIAVVVSPGRVPDCNHFAWCRGKRVRSVTKSVLAVGHRRQFN